MGARGGRWFAGVWEWSTRHEGQHERQLREQVVRGASGRTLEIGYGVGSNWAFLPGDIEYTGIEPDPFMRKRAERYLPSDRTLVAIEGNAESLAFADETFDTVIGTLVFCTIPKPDRALAEVHRVLKPGGEFRFFEHVRPRGRFAATLLNAITPLWKTLGGGCHPNRDTLAAIAKAGLAVDELQRVKIGPLPAIVGSARAASKG